MPLNTLNKVVSLVVTGGLVLFLSIVGWWAWLPGNFQLEVERLKSLTGSGAVGAVFMLLPLVVFLGMVCDALTSLLFQHLLRAITKNEQWCKRLGCRRDYEHLNSWATKFRKSLAAKRTYPIDDDDPDGLRGLAIGLALRSSVKEFDYALEHYAAYVMAGNFMVIMIAVFLFTVSDLVFGAHEESCLCIVLFATLCAFCLLSTYAVKKYCYAHEVAYRAGFIALWAPAQSGESGGTKESDVSERGVPKHGGGAQ